MKKIKLILIVLLSLSMTILFAIYQRFTGPTHPRNILVKIEQKEYSFNLLRSTIITEERRKPIIDLDFKEDLEIQGIVLYRAYPPIKTENNEYKNYDTILLSRNGNRLCANLPNQEKAGKLQYFIKLKYNNKEYSILEDDPVVIRFRGDVPPIIIIPHIASMFSSMFFAMMCLFTILFYRERIRRILLFAKISSAFLMVGGLILGLYVQYYAFNVYWAGFPFAWDLTDNKTLIAVIIWILALVMNRKIYKPIYIIIAIIVMFLVFSIPHSMNGSQRNPQTGEMEYK